MRDISKETILGASAGDTGAFKIIYQEYFGLVSNVVYRITNRREDAEDITQEVFMTIYHNLKHFRFESSLKTWIYRIAVNQAINHSRKTAKHRYQTVEYREGFEVPSPGGDPRRAMDQKFNEDLIRNLLGAITAEQRACLVLRSVEGLSYQDIARSLKIPVNTVRSRIKRAREAMLALRKEVVK